MFDLPTSNWAQDKISKHMVFKWRVIVVVSKVLVNVLIQAMVIHLRSCELTFKGEKKTKREKAHKNVLLKYYLNSCVFKWEDIKSSNKYHWKNMFFLRFKVSNSLY
jgi:hypothetical protein